MKISKRKLLSLIQENLEEMAMDFDTQDRPHRDVTSKLQTGDTPLKKIPFPSTGNQNQNFQELLASERYKEVIANLRRYTGVNDVLGGNNPNMRLMGMMADAHNRIIQIESGHKDELEQLAIDSVCEYFGIERDDVNWNVNLLTRNDRIDTEDFLRDQPNEDNPEEVDPEEDEFAPEIQQQQRGEEELFNNLKVLNLERAKERLMNAIVQGGSKTGHYLYHLVSQGLEDITGSDQLINLYGVLMSINDTNYWQLGDDIMDQLQSSVGGKVKVTFPGAEESGMDDNYDDGEEGEEGGSGEEDGEEGGNPSKPTVTVYGINFPVLVHEVFKGILTIYKTWSQTKDKKLYRQVQRLENTMDKEIWDLRLGPAIWNRLRQSIPERVLLGDDKRLQSYLYMNIFKMGSEDTKKFLVFMKEVLSNSDNGKRLMETMVRSIEEMLNNEDYEQSLQQFNDDLDDIKDETDEGDLGDFLSGLGIDLPSDN